jgi:hypothetical protein
MDPHPLGMIPPTDDRHRQLYGLTAGTIPTVPTPVVLGINWYSVFDHPSTDEQGRWWIGREVDWGQVRGGHAICAKPSAIRDSMRNWTVFDQGSEGACVGFSCARMMTLLNSETYSGFWIYHQAQRIDEWPGEDYDGTSVRAGCDVLRTTGPVRIFRGKEYGPDAVDGIEANRWAESVDEILACLHQSGAGGFVTLLNSWGRSYPHYVRLPLEGLDRLLREGGEATVVTDR